VEARRIRDGGDSARDRTWLAFVLLAVVLYVVLAYALAGDPSSSS
jgi:hypothetical protein